MYVQHMMMITTEQGVFIRRVQVGPERWNIQQVISTSVVSSERLTYLRKELASFHFGHNGWWWWWWWWCGGGGGGGFFLACEDFGWLFDSEIPRLRFKWRLAPLIPLFRPGSVHSGSASWGDCVRVFPDELRVSSFPDRFPHSACHSQTTPTLLGQGCMRVKV